MRTAKAALRAITVTSAVLAMLNTGAVQAQKAKSLGIFRGSSDVGAVHPAGTIAYDSTNGSYTITSTGANIWGTEDAFTFVWKKVSGNVSLTANINFPEAGANPHRKAVLMLRQDLDKDSAYADAAVHGVGMTALQSRAQKGMKSTDIELYPQGPAPRTVRIEKRGDMLTMWASIDDEPLHQVAGPVEVHLNKPFYVGIGLSSHNVSVTEKVIFTNVKLQRLSAKEQ